MYIFIIISLPSSSSNPKKLVPNGIESIDQPYFQSNPIICLHTYHSARFLLQSSLISGSRLISNGEDRILVAKTGYGKTVSWVVPRLLPFTRSSTGLIFVITVPLTTIYRTRGMLKAKLSGDLIWSSQARVRQVAGNIAF
jgi:hypothetical protein